jgi:hypothetical protein
MMESWKFSKGLLLTAFITGLIWFLLLGFAYQQHRSSEILTGVIGGLTVILGMITAEWLRSCREQVEVTRSRLWELISLLQPFLYHFDEFMQDPFSRENFHHLEEFNRIYSALHSLIRTTRWPQPNAGKIRDAAGDLTAKLHALQSDAHENGHIWTLEKRMRLFIELSQISKLIWDRSPEEVDDFQVQIEKYRESPKNEGFPVGWTKRTSNP